MCKNILSHTNYIVKKDNAAFAARGKRFRSKRQDVAALTFARYLNIRAYAHPAEPFNATM